MSSLLFVPRRLARTRRWTHDDITTAWHSGDDGSRLFALGLIQADPALAMSDVLVDGIRRSRSALEQHEALSAALGCDLSGADADAVRSAVESELRGVPRPDGIDAQITGDGSRLSLAERLVEKLSE